MSSTVLCAAILLACVLTFSAAQTSCKGRCGAEYARGDICHCDYSCLSYGECCKDYESQCTTKNSCKGRCGEAFKRGRVCSCDSECVKYKQCCPDHNSHCDAEGDHLIPLVDPTSYPLDDPSNDMYSQVFPNDEVKDPEASPTPESTSGYGLSMTDLLDPISTEPTQDPDFLELNTDKFTAFSQTQATIMDNKATQADDSLSTLYPTSDEAPTKNTDAIDPTSSANPGTTLPQPTTAADHVSNQPTSTSGPHTEYSPTELETVGEPTIASSDKPDVTTPPYTSSVAPVPTQGSSTVQELDLEFTTSPASALDSTPIPEANASNPVYTESTDVVTTGQTSTDFKDPSTSVSPAGSEYTPELVTLTTHIPTSTDAGQDEGEAAPELTTADALNVTPDLTKPTTSEATSKPQEPSPDTLAKPSSKPETKPLDDAQTPNIDDPRDYQADDSNDTNLCSGRPVSGVTTLGNGTMVVFRGHYFWILDRYMVPGPARSITQVWGVPSPIDTVFTRCNCQSKTYIFKGSQYWRFENDVLDPNYPKVIETGFDGLRGQITAALSVPQYQRRRESVYFFKRGGLVQKYSYQFGTNPTCGRRVEHVYTVRNRRSWQAVSRLGPAINIRTSWRGFPSTITAAVSVPNFREPEGYKYYVFSRSKSYNVRMDYDRPFISAPTANASPQSNDFFKCSKKV